MTMCQIALVSRLVTDTHALKDVQDSYRNISVLILTSATLPVPLSSSGQITDCRLRRDPTDCNFLVMSGYAC